MWSVTNKTPFAAAGTWVQDRDGNKLWLVVAKATFDIRADGATFLSDEQMPVLLMPEPVGEAGKSLVYESDLLGIKPYTDVLVNGQAWAPRGAKTKSVDVHLIAGPIAKRLRVFGDRFWDDGRLGATISSAVPFESMPIKYERAYGGWDKTSPDPMDHRMDDRNPVGTGFLIRREHCEGVRLPNVEDPNHLITLWHDRPEPAGLNAVDCSWSPRRQLAGTYDDRWLEDRFPLWAEDFDPRYRNCAPRDQQAQGYLQGGEVVDLTNLSREGKLTFVLPTVRLSCSTRFGIRRIEHPAELCTVIVEPDVPRVMISWQAYVLCNRRSDDLDETIVSEAA